MVLFLYYVYFLNLVLVSQILVFSIVFYSGTVPMFLLSTAIVIVSILINFHVVYDPFIFLPFNTVDIKAERKIYLLYSFELYFHLSILYE